MQNEILILLKDIQLRLIRIEEELRNLKLSSNKMDQHINFVDSVYENIRKPFSNILSLYNGKEIKI
jgi:hypothetical protein